MATLLIVDDDTALRDGIAETIADLGHAPRIAASGREALAALTDDDIDGVLLDLRMPDGMDGIEVLRRIRRLPLQVADSMVPRGQHSDGSRAEGAAVLLQIGFIRRCLFHLRSVSVIHGNFGLRDLQKFGV